MCTILIILFNTLTSYLLSILDLGAAIVGSGWLDQVGPCRRQITHSPRGLFGKLRSGWDHRVAGRQEQGGVYGSRALTCGNLVPGTGSDQRYGSNIILWGVWLRMIAPFHTYGGCGGL